MIALSRKKVIGITIAVVMAIALAVSLPLVFSGGILGSQTTPMSIKGHVIIEKNGDVVVDKDNIIVNTGYSAISYQMGTGYEFGVFMGYAMQSFDVIGIGADGTAPTAADVDLIGMQCRQDGDFANLGVGIWKITHTFDDGEMSGPDANTEYTAAPYTVLEAGVFNQNVPGVVGIMLCRQTFGTITIGVADTLAVTWIFSVMG